MPDQVATISFEQALAIAGRPEDQFYDKKSREARGKTVQKIAVAFGNTEGGEIAFGIIDDAQEIAIGDRIVPLADPEEGNAILQSIYEVNPPLTFRYSFVQVEGKSGVLLRVFVDKGQHVHSTADGTVYRRLGASSVAIKDPNEITRIAFAKGALSYENTKLEGHPPEQIVDAAEANFLTGAIPEGPDSLAFCINEGLIDRSDWCPTVAGALLLSDNPQGLVPTRCECRIVFYDTREDKPERHHLKINETVSGPL